MKVQELQERNTILQQKKAHESSTSKSQWIKALFLSAWLMVMVDSIYIRLWKFSALRNRVTKSLEAISGPMSIFTVQSWIGPERRWGGGGICV